MYCAVSVSSWLIVGILEPCTHWMSSQGHIGVDWSKDEPEVDDIMVGEGLHYGGHDGCRAKPRRDLVMGGGIVGVIFKVGGSGIVSLGGEDVGE